MILVVISYIYIYVCRYVLYMLQVSSSLEKAHSLLSGCLAGVYIYIYIYIHIIIIIMMMIIHIHIYIYIYTCVCVYIHAYIYIYIYSC